MGHHTSVLLTTKISWFLLNKKEQCDKFRKNEIYLFIYFFVFQAGLFKVGLSLSKNFVLFASMKAL